MSFRNWTISLFFLLLLLVQTACERPSTAVLGGIDCTECYQNKPEWGPINITVTINDENPAIPLTIYFGNIEENNVDTTVFVETPDYWIDVRPDFYYSLSAEYKVGDKKVFVIDGDELASRYTSTGCNEPCYYFKGGNFDVRLRE